MKTLRPGVRVRFVGQKWPFKNIVSYLLVGRTGTITHASTVAGMDWYVEMDLGAYDIDAKAEALIPIEDDEADKDGCDTDQFVSTTPNQRLHCE